MRFTNFLDLKRLMKGDSYSSVGFCLTEVPILLLIEETDGYTMERRVGRKSIKRVLKA